MAINACSINSFTINAGRCRNKFADLVPILHPPIVATAGTNPRVLRDTFKFARPFDLEDNQVFTFEQPIVSVTVEMFGQSGTDTQDVSMAQADFVTVTGFEVSDQAVSDQITVNIFDLKFE